MILIPRPTLANKPTRTPYFDSEPIAIPRVSSTPCAPIVPAVPAPGPDLSDPDIQSLKGPRKTPTASIYIPDLGANRATHSGRWRRVLPCDDEFLDWSLIEDPGLYLWTLEMWIYHYSEWLDHYRERGYHDIPNEVLLSILLAESRGDPNAVSVAGAIGVFQVMPGEIIPGNPPRAILKQTSKNIFHGIGILEAYTWESRYLIRGIDPIYRDLIYSAVPESNTIEYWFSREGRVAIGMYQCGPGNYKDVNSGSCGTLGGWAYVDDVLTCWYPWISELTKGGNRKAGWKQ